VFGRAVPRFLAGASASVSLVILASACGGNGDGETGAGEPKAGGDRPAAIDPADFRAEVDHPLHPLSSLRFTVFEGNKRDPETGETARIRVETRVLRKPGRVAGVPVTVVEVREYEGGELVEHTRDYYAQHRDGSVWYFGERVDDYEGGKIVGHEGQWLAGEGNARPGLFVPAEPKVGQAFRQERKPGVAVDRATVVAVGLNVSTPAGEFSDCVKTRDFAPLDKITEFKYRCPGVGIVREDQEGGRLVLVRYS
jgi:hypothetical protein